MKSGIIFVVGELWIINTKLSSMEQED